MKAVYTTHVMKLVLGVMLASSIIVGLFKDFSVNPIEVLGLFILVLVVPNSNLAWKDIVAIWNGRK
ncbi:hypothetical protein P9X10_00365 [Bacillus cereus]|nr:hypothetical protein [Bacillus cereus]